MFEEFFDQDEDFVLDLDDALTAELEGTEWEARAEALDEDTPIEDRIRLYQQIRDAGVLPDDAAFFLIAWPVEIIAEERVQDIYQSQYNARFEQLAEEHGLDEDTLAVLEDEELPAEYRALQLEFAQVVDALMVAALQSFGEHKMASLYKTNPEEFDTRYDEGYAYFFGEDNGYASDLDVDAEMQD